VGEKAKKGQSEEREAALLSPLSFLLKRRGRFSAKGRGMDGPEASRVKKWSVLGWGDATGV
jgi:hypothetical protein